MIDVEIACVGISVCGNVFCIKDNDGMLRLPTLLLDSAQGSQSNITAIAKEIMEASGNSAAAARLIDVVYDGRLMTVGYLMTHFRQIRRFDAKNAWIAYGEWRQSKVPSIHRKLVNFARAMVAEDKYAMCD